jgi:predicted NUDIX family phosphoesterase
MKRNHRGHREKNTEDTERRKRRAKLMWYHPAMTENVEQVLVVESDWVHALHPSRGFIQVIHPDFVATLPSKAFFLARPKAEKDPTFRQVIPYVLICLNGAFLTVTRHKTQGESRLHDKMSVGIGGHINPVDGSPENLLDAGLRRELSEELAVDDPPGLSSLQPLGLIFDDTDEVSQVHLGLVLRWDVLSPVSIRETDKMHGEYLTPGQIGAHRDRLENWSRLVYDSYLAVMPDQRISKPSYREARS